MRILILVGLMISFISCQSEGCKTKTSSSFTKEYVNSTLRISNKADYSTAFIEKLKNEQGKRQIYLNGNQMIINQRDTVYFPTHPAIGQQKKLVGRTGMRAYALSIKRLNQTTIDYRIEIVDFGKHSIDQKGTVDLGVNFYLGAETDYDERMGINYFSTEFSEEKEDCYTHIRLGHVEDNPNKALLGKLIKNCNGKIGDVDLDNCPAMVEK